MINDNLGLIHDIRAIFYKIKKKLGLHIIDEEKIECPAGFNEFPSCEMCGEVKNKEVLNTLDKMRIVECNNCGLWFTNPRIDEEASFE